MPILNPYCLHFHSGLHLGTRGLNLEEAGLSIPADTLFAALALSWELKEGAYRAFCAPFIAQLPDPPFLLTSAFPFVGDILFFPMPVDRARLFRPETLRGRSKQIKRIAYFSQVLLEKAQRGELLDEDIFPEDETDNPKTGAALQNGALWFSTQEADKLPPGFQRPAGRRHAWHNLHTWSSGRVPRVTVGRLT